MIVLLSHVGWMMVVTRLVIEQIVLVVIILTEDRVIQDFIIQIMGVCRLGRGEGASAGRKMMGRVSLVAGAGVHTDIPLVGGVRF